MIRPTEYEMEQVNDAVKQYEAELMEKDIPGEKRKEMAEKFFEEQVRLYTLTDEEFVAQNLLDNCGMTLRKEWVDEDGERKLEYGIYDTILGEQCGDPLYEIEDVMLEAAEAMSLMGRVYLWADNADDFQKINKRIQEMGKDFYADYDVYYLTFNQDNGEFKAGQNAICISRCPVISDFSNLLGYEQDYQAYEAIPSLKMKFGHALWDPDIWDPIPYNYYLANTVDNDVYKWEE